MDEIMDLLEYVSDGFPTYGKKWGQDSSSIVGLTVIVPSIMTFT